MPRMTQREWDPYKDEIEILYVRDRKSLVELMKIMQDRHGFVAKKRQYVYILEQWGFWKNKTEKAALSQAMAAQEVPVQIDSPGSLTRLDREMSCPAAGEIDHESESWNENQSQHLDLMLAFPYGKTMLDYMETRSRMSKTSQTTFLGQTILVGCIRLNDGSSTGVLRQALEETQPHSSDLTNCLRHNLMYHAIGLPNATNDMMLEDISRYLRQAKSPVLDLFPLLARFASIQDAQQDASLGDMFSMVMAFVQGSSISRLCQNREATALMREGVMWCRDFLQAHRIQADGIPAGNGSVEHARQQVIAEACCVMARYLLCEPRGCLPPWARESRHHLGISSIAFAILVTRTASNFYPVDSGDQFAMPDFHQQIWEGASALLLTTDEVLWGRLLDSMVETEIKSMFLQSYTFYKPAPSSPLSHFGSPQVVADDSVFYDNLGRYVQQFVLKHLAPEMYETDSDQLSPCSEIDVFTTPGSHRGSHSPMSPFPTRPNSQPFAQDFGMDGLNDPLLFPNAYPEVHGVGSGTGVPDLCNTVLDFNPDEFLFGSRSFPS